MNRKSIEVLVTYVTVLGVVSIVLKLVVRHAEGPDFSRTMRMRAWRCVKAVADGQSEWWGDLGLRAGTQYQKSRL